MVFKVALTLLLVAHGALTSALIPSDFQGTWTDPILSSGSGGLTICVSSNTSATTTTYYGQGLLSNAAYLRGTISTAAEPVWTGTYYMPGIDAFTGQFSVTLKEGSPLTLDWTTWQMKPSTFSAVSLNSSQTSTAPPTPQSCFQTDAAYIADNFNHNYTGTWSNGYTVWNMENTLSNGLEAAYTYIYNSGYVSIGDNEGTNFENGQISLGQWYEQGGSNGIQMWVAKNKDTFYYLWWAMPSMSQWGSVANPQQGVNFGMSTYTFASAQITVPANQNFCMILPTEADESKCQLWSTQTQYVSTAVQAAPAASTCPSLSCPSVTCPSVTCPSSRANAVSVAILVFVLVTMILAAIMLSTLNNPKPAMSSSGTASSEMTSSSA